MDSLVRSFLFSGPLFIYRFGLIVWIFYVIRREMAHFLLTRQQHLIEKTHGESVQARTVLVTGIPRRYLTQEALYKVFNTLPGGIRKIWINRSVCSPSLSLIPASFAGLQGLEKPSRRIRPPNAVDIQT